MTQLQVLNEIVRPAIADSLGIERERDVWLPCTLQQVDPYEELEWLDLLDIAWRLERRCLQFGVKIEVDAKELEIPAPGMPMTVADVVTLICEKLKTLGAPAVVIMNRAM